MMMMCGEWCGSNDDDDDDGYGGDGECGSGCGG